MTSPGSSHTGWNILISFMMLSGVVLIIVAGVIGFPYLRDAVTPPPTPFGEDEPDLRPTVTPLSVNNAPVPDVLPAELPQTPLLSPAQTLTPVPVVTPLASDASEWIPTRIVIPAINLDAPIETVGWSVVGGVSTWNIPNHYAAGWLQVSATLGKKGNTVLDGHHNIAGEVFRHLVDLKPGVVITVYSAQRAFTYQVSAMHILPDLNQPIEVRRRNARWIQATLDERLTLVTCWPYTGNTHRLIVVATPLKPAQPAP